MKFSDRLLGKRLDLKRVSEIRLGSGKTAPKLFGNLGVSWMRRPTTA